MILWTFFVFELKRNLHKASCNAAKRTLRKNELNADASARPRAAKTARGEKKANTPTQTPPAARPNPKP